MIIIPAIDLRGGKCVQLVGGVFGSEEIELDDVGVVAEKFYNAGIKRLHVIDLDAAKSVGDNIPIIKDIISVKNCPVEVGGGIRSIEKAEELIALGADYVIVGTAAVKNIEFLKDLANKIGKEKIIVSLDYKNGKVLTHGWDKSTDKTPVELGRELAPYCGAFLMTFVDNEGQLKGPDVNYLPEIVREVPAPIIASGGVGTMDDLRKLKEIGVYGVVIGMAIYKGKIDLIEALNL
jgi:phosphoribosylformimino-5-aminoimidazole carboxamide ribotide isomerase